MEQRANFFDESIDRVQAEFEKMQKRFEKRRKEVEKETERQLKRLRKSPFVKRVESLREDAQKQIETNVDNFLKLLPIASQSEVRRLNRKVNTLQRKVTALERAKSEAAAKPPVQKVSQAS